MNENYFDLFGEDVFSDVDGGDIKARDLAKALEVGYNMGTTDQTGFGALRVESLEQSLKVIEANEKSPALWNALKKGKAKGAVEEFTLLNEYGDANAYSEGSLPEEYDEDLSRTYEQVKLVGTVGQVSFFAKSNAMIKEAEAIQVKMKTIAMLKYLDTQLINGDASMISTEFNGLWKQFNNRVTNSNENIINLEGKRLRPETLNEAGLVIMDNYGDPTNLQGWFPNSVHAGYVDHLISSKQWFVGQPVNEVTVSPERWNLGGSSGSLHRDIFMRHRGETYKGKPYPKLNTAKTAFAKTNKNAPNTLDSTTCSLATSGSGYSIPAAVYDYAVVPVNKYGCGAAFEVKSITISGSKEKVVLTISDNGSAPGYEATKFDIYRKLHSDTALTSYLYVTSFAASATKEDTGLYIPGTGRGFVCEWNPDQVFRFDQLLPLMKMDLATISDAKRFLLKLYGTPKVFNANKMVWIINIGSTAWS